MIMLDRDRRAVLVSEATEVIEVPWEEGARLINECDYLFATEIRELEELTLGLTIVEAKAQAPVTTVEDSSPLARLKLGGRPIEQDDTCRVFHLVFDRNHMISYMVANESYGKYPEPPEEFTGKLFRMFSHSYLLEFTRRTSYATDEYPSVLMHFEIACLNHIVDVICTAPPKIAVGKSNSKPTVVN
jgi:hypothetical protein